MIAPLMLCIFIVGCSKGYIIVEDKGPTDISNCPGRGFMNYGTPVAACQQRARELGANTLNYRHTHGQCVIRQCYSTNLQLGHYGGGSEYTIYTEIYACNFTF